MRSVKHSKCSSGAFTQGGRGGNRTRTEVTLHRILSPVRLPFRHSAFRRSASNGESAPTAIIKSYFTRYIGISETCPQARHLGKTALKTCSLAPCSVAPASRRANQRGQKNGRRPGIAGLIGCARACHLSDPGPSGKQTQDRGHGKMRALGENRPVRRFGKYVRSAKYVGSRYTQFAAGRDQVSVDLGRVTGGATGP